MNQTTDITMQNGFSSLRIRPPIIYICERIKKVAESVLIRNWVLNVITIRL